MWWQFRCIEELTPAIININHRAFQGSNIIFTPNLRLCIKINSGFQTFTGGIEWVKRLLQQNIWSLWLRAQHLKIEYNTTNIVILLLIRWLMSHLIVPILICLFSSLFSQLDMNSCNLHFTNILQLWQYKPLTLLTLNWFHS